MNPSGNEASSSKNERYVIEVKPSHQKGGRLTSEYKKYLSGENVNVYCLCTGDSQKHSSVDQTEYFMDEGEAIKVMNKLPNCFSYMVTTA